MLRLYFTGYACCGLFASIPHACTRVHTRCLHKNEVFFTSFSLVGGWVGKPFNPIKNTSFALGMRRACVSMVQPHRSDSVARSTPTAPQSKQERPKNLYLTLFFVKLQIKSSLASKRATNVM